jgi:ubiquitin C-terminal hydrolase
MTEMYSENTPIVPDETLEQWMKEKELEEKQQRATEKVMERNHTGKGTEVTSLPKPIIIHEGNDIIVSGVRYRKVEEPKTLKELFEIYVEYGNWAQSKHVIAQELVNIVKEIVPEHRENPIMSEFRCGYNECIREIEENLK